MKIFLVGGAVRDKLMGLEPRDKDYLIIDSSALEMEKNGFQKVGKSHTVYLHPVTKEEYTLSDDLKADLGRRDLTINAMAMIDEELIDYFGGKDDIRKRIFRHVNEENFYIDPLRIYRVARFAAQHPEFTIDHSTMVLMRRVIETDAFRNLDGERISQELYKALTSITPEMFFLILQALDILKIHFADLNSKDINYLKKTHNPLLRFASLFFHRKTKSVSIISDRLKISNEWREAALMASNMTAQEKLLTNPEAVIGLFHDYDVYRRPFRLDVMRELLNLIGKDETANNLNRWYAITSKITYEDISAFHLEGKEIAFAMRNLRIKTLENLNYPSQDLRLI